VIALRRIDHVCLRVADLDEAARRWCIEFGFSERRDLRTADRAYLTWARSASPPGGTRPAICS
jgi:catechol 2,3-dioxygenase-like lactoylglutathione lyase family enzyme